MIYAERFGQPDQFLGKHSHAARGFTRAFSCKVSACNAMLTVCMIAEADTEAEDDAESPAAQKGKYAAFWGEFGKSMKLGIIEDGSNKGRLSKLLRFQTTKSNGELTSFDEYVSRMKPKQKEIYFIAGGLTC